jgi:hypothetical protein
MKDPGISLADVLGPLARDRGAWHGMLSTTRSAGGRTTWRGVRSQHPGGRMKDLNESRPPPPCLVAELALVLCFPQSKALRCIQQREGIPYWAETPSHHPFADAVTVGADTVIERKVGRHYQNERDNQ